MNFPAELKYSKDHEWVKTVDETTVLVGITDFAQSELGDLVFINLPQEGDDVTAEESFCDVESVKAVSDVMSPVTGVVAEVNSELEDEPQMLNEDPALVNFPVCKDNIYKIDVEETKKAIDQYRPEFIIFGKSMVLHKEPVAAIRKYVDETGLQTTIMYDMAHVLGLIGDYFQKPFEEGAEIVTGSTHKTFFGPQRGIVGVNYKKGDLKYGLWETIENRAFPGSVSNHHLGTQLGLLMAAYEMNQFKDEYQKAVVNNAKSFAKSLKAAGLDVAGDPANDYTETHQVIVNVGYGTGPDVAMRLERNSIICNYQATPEEEGFTASGALRMGVNEMTRFGFGPKEFDQLAQIMADCILRGKEVKEDVAKLRSGYTEMKFCFSENDVVNALNDLAKKSGI